MANVKKFFAVGCLLLCIVLQGLLFGTCDSTVNTDGGIKSTISVPVTEDKDYYISDFLQPEARIMQAIMSQGGIVTQPVVMVIVPDMFNFDNDYFITVKNVLGEVKLSPYALDPQEAEFYKAPLLLRLVYGDDEYLSIVSIGINYIDEDKSGVNVFLNYKNNEVNNTFAALVDDAAIELLINTAKEISESKKDKDYYISDFLQSDAVMQAMVTHVSNDKGILRYDDIFNFDNEYFITIENVLSEVKLSPYALDTQETLTYWLRGFFEPKLSLLLVYGNDEYLSIDINDIDEDEIGVNVYVTYRSNGVNNNFVALINDAAIELLINKANEISESKKGE